MSLFGFKIKVWICYLQLFNFQYSMLNIKAYIGWQVKKHWHCEYMECSAKFNWHVFAVFREIMHLVDSAASANGASLHGGLVNCLHHSLPQHWHLSNHHFNFHRRRRSRTFSRATLYSNTRSHFLERFSTILIIFRWKNLIIHHRICFPFRQLFHHYFLSF